MAFSTLGLLVLFHVLFAALWFGGLVYQVVMIGGNLMAAGPAAGGFLRTLAQRGGIGKYFAITGGLAILFGGWLYGQEMADGALEALSGRGLWLTLGAVVAVVTYIHGLAINKPLESKWIAYTRSIQGTPTAEQARQLQDYGMRMGKAGMHSMVLLTIAMLLMLLNRVFV